MKRISLILHISLLSICCASAQTLSLDSCINMALRANRQVEKAHLLTRQREFAASALKANFLPNFKASARDLYSTGKGSFDVTGGYLPTFSPAADGTLQPNVLLNPATGQPMMSADGVTPVFQQYAYFPTQNLKYKFGNILQAGVTVEQPLYMGGKIRAGYAMGKMAREMALQNERLTEAQVIVGTEEAFALLVRATEMNTVAQLYDSLLLKLRHDVESAKARGMASHNDVLKVGVKKDEAELQLRQSENGIRLAQMNLCRMIGLPLTAKVYPANPPLSEETGQAIREADYMRERQSTAGGSADGYSASVAQRPEAAMLGMKSQLAKEKVRLERSEYLPQVGLAVGYNYLNGLKLNDRRLLDGGNFGALLNVSIPLYHFGEGRNKVRAARMEAEQARVEQQELTEQMQLEATREANNVDEALLELEVTTRSLAQAAENLRMARKSYDAGMEPLSDLLEAQVLYQQASAREVESRCQLALALTRYRKATGQLFR